MTVTRSNHNVKTEDMRRGDHYGSLSSNLDNDIENCMPKSRMSYYIFVFCGFIKLSSDSLVVERLPSMQEATPLFFRNQVRIRI